MKQFVVTTLLLAATPMLLFNPLGRNAFVGYYVGVLATWFVAVCIERSALTTRARRAYE